MMRKVNATSSLAQNSFSSKNHKNAIDVLAFNSPSSSLFGHEFVETDVHKHLWSTDPTRMNKIDEDFDENW
jgi:hypothetical protein